MSLHEVDHIPPIGKSIPVEIHEFQDTREEGTDHQRESHAAFDVAPAWYRRREFSTARQAFFILRALWKDSVVDTFVHRCDDFLKHSPPEGWDGVFDETGQ